jgi:tetratricopeptide (TPR) repeat protein
MATDAGSIGREGDPPHASFAVAIARARALLRSDPAQAAEQARDIVDRHPESAAAWRLLGDALYRSGDAAGGAEAYGRSIPASVNDRELIRAGAALAEGNISTAERLLRTRLKADPHDVAAIRMMAELATRLGRYGDAQNLFRRALELAPGFDPARFGLALVLLRQSRLTEALAEVAALLDRDPANIGYRNLKASILVRLGDYDEPIRIYQSILAERPDQPRIWMSLGHALKTAGRAEEGIAAYRRSIAIEPGLGESWWSLANLKTYRFGEEDAAAMRAALANDAIGEEDRLHLHFSLGKYHEDAGDHAASFGHYDQGNRLRHAQLGYDPDETSASVARARSLYTPGFLAAREGEGCHAPDPIFVLGLPRAGSTLIEQILASHSAVEGTMELPDIDLIARRLVRRNGGEGYPEMLAELSPADRDALGQEYLDRTRVQRRLGRPMFVDKMPNNWAHVGLIHLILPKARIIDARRHPLGCCFSAWKQHFARGQAFSYDLADIGRYYADYIALMAHFDAVLPGRVHRVIYEEMVADPEGETRRLLAYCGLPFEEGCLRFYENDRAVRTASSEQVRKPIYAQGVDQWRAYEAWLEPLKAALGEVLEYWDRR